MVGGEEENCKKKHTIKKKVVVRENVKTVRFLE